MWEEEVEEVEQALEPRQARKRRSLRFHEKGGVEDNETLAEKKEVEVGEEGDRSVFFDQDEGYNSSDQTVATNSETVDQFVAEKAYLCSETKRETRTLKTEIVEDNGVKVEHKSKLQVTEFDVERVLQEQETHDLFCPNCNSCITKRVILRKRKRTGQGFKYDSKHKKVHETQDDLDTSAALTEIADEDCDRELELFRCLSWFRFFIPIGFSLPGESSISAGKLVEDAPQKQLDDTKTDSELKPGEGQGLSEQKVNSKEGRSDAPLIYIPGSEVHGEQIIIGEKDCPINNKTSGKAFYEGPEANSDKGKSDTHLIDIPVYEVHGIQIIAGEKVNDPIDDKASGDDIIQSAEVIVTKPIGRTDGDVITHTGPHLPVSVPLELIAEPWDDTPSVVGDCGTTERTRNEWDVLKGNVHGALGGEGKNRPKFWWNDQVDTIEEEVEDVEFERRKLRKSSVKKLQRVHELKAGGIHQVRMPLKNVLVGEDSEDDDVEVGSWKLVGHVGGQPGDDKKKISYGGDDERGMGDWKLISYGGDDERGMGDWKLISYGGDDEREMGNWKLTSHGGDYERGIGNWKLENTPEPGNWRSHGGDDERGVGNWRIEASSSKDDSRQVSFDDLDCLGQLSDLRLTLCTASCLARFFKSPVLPKRTQLLHLHYCSGLISIHTSAFRSMKRLRELHIQECGDAKELIIGDDQQTAEDRIPLSIEFLFLSQLPRLKIILNGTPPCKVFQNLRYLSISKCHELKDATWVLKLPCLEDLILSDCNEMEHMISSDGEEAVDEVALLPRLKRLALMNLPKLKFICKQILVFPALEFLEITNICHELTKLPLGKESAINLKEIRGEREWWNSLQWEDNNTKYAFAHLFIEGN
ncbi:hypothetical protein J5N97_024700 [Dioscorea zingiberensis]|uniref:Disease resistance protein At4g27190-like leucine-rich repeats domain-containing protein n=1 Tax=Dioscorea zingiberensis TaxID=325984 RepID=A0A9D5C7R6_9LILI|nr:hypothetical protein J5N97_024700 [Dioscorea zingiberensis]